jgi:putative transposase
MKTVCDIGLIGTRPKVYRDWRIALGLGGLPKVDSACEAELCAAVEQDPRAAGYPFSVWTCADLVRHLIRRGFASVSAETIRQHLHGLRYRLLRPVLSINSPDPDYAAKEQQLAHYREQARRREIILLYEDEVDLNLLPGVIGCWTKRGTQRRVPTPGQNVKRYGFGAVNLISGQLTFRINERKNSDGFCALLEQLIQDYCPGDSYDGPQLVLVVDNFIIHRSQKTSAVLARYADRLTVFALPTYSPQLNVIELLWKYLRRRVTHNHLFQSITELLAAVEDFIHTLSCQSKMVLSITGCSE